MTIQFIRQDANLTDGKDLSKVDAIYAVNGVQVRIPANTPEDAVTSALYEALGLDPQVEAQRQEKLEALRAENVEPLDPNLAPQEDEVFQALVKKIIWLEQEILDVRAREELATKTQAVE